ncbi:unnamed protein product [Symbiodinium sp. CCMP2592]|nr:unnamed protein product [Symbiodinium sp. CCMP2592]
MDDRIYNAVRANVLSTSSRTQRVIALSSGESELLASASVLSDAMLVRECVKFALGFDESPLIQHHVDSTAALGALRRQGVGKIRYLSTRILWQQLLVKQGIIIANKISTDYNVADIGTKGLSRARTLFLKHLLHVYDEAEARYVGEDEMTAQVEKDAMKEAVRRFRQAHHGGRVPKQQLRQIMIAALLSFPAGAAATEVNCANALSLPVRYGSYILMTFILLCTMLLQGCRSEQQWVQVVISVDWSGILVALIVLVGLELVCVRLGVSLFQHLWSSWRQDDEYAHATEEPALSEASEQPEPEDDECDDGPSQVDGCRCDATDEVDRDPEAASSTDDQGFMRGQPGPAGPRSYEPEPLDGDFTDVQNVPAAVIGDLDDDLEANAHDAPQGQAELAVQDLVHVDPHMSWFVAPIAGRRVHIFRTCQGLMNASRVIRITEREREMQWPYRNFPVCFYCRHRAQAQMRRERDPPRIYEIG